MTKPLHDYCRVFGGKDRLKIWVFKRFLITDIDDADVTLCGRVFHGREAATEKARSSMVERRVRRTTSADDEEQCIVQ